jgi:hypothetical protein
MATKSVTRGIAVADGLKRVWNGEGEMSATVAKQVLKLGFSDDDVARLHQLAERSNDGTLTPAEGVEYDGYILAGDLLAIAQSKARMALKLPIPKKDRHG